MHCSLPLLLSVCLPHLVTLIFPLPSYPVWVWCFIMTAQPAAASQRCKLMPPPLSLLSPASSISQPPILARCERDMIAAAASAAVPSEGRLDWTRQQPSTCTSVSNGKRKVDGIGMSGIIMQWCNGKKAVGNDASKLPFHTYFSFPLLFPACQPFNPPIRRIAVTQRPLLFSLVASVWSPHEQ